MISLIAAIGKNNELGKNNSLIWNLPGDMQYFKETTMNHTVIMGLNTYKSIGKALPKRRNVVLTNQDLKELPNDVIGYNNIDEMIKKEIKKDEECFIIGGASMYNYFYNIADKLYLTMINDDCPDADVFFPNINENIWKKTVLKNNYENNINYKFVLFERI